MIPHRKDSLPCHTVLMTEPLSEMRAVEAEWVGVDDFTLQYINQIVAQLGVVAGDPAVPDSIHLMFGTAAQPVFVGSPERVAALAAQLQVLPIKPVVRLVMSRERAEELLQILVQTLAQYDLVKDAKHARA